MTIDPDKTTLTCMRMRRSILSLGLGSCNEQERPLVEETISYRDQAIDRFENRLRGEAWEVAR